MYDKINTTTLAHVSLYYIITYISKKVLVTWVNETKITLIVFRISHCIQID